MSLTKNFAQISNAITAAEDTGNVQELYQLEDVVATAMMTGRINVVEAAQLQADITIATDALQRNDYLDEGYSAIEQGL